MKQQNPVQDQVRQETDRRAGQDGRGVVEVPAEIHGFGQQIEKCDADDRARR